MKKFSLMFAVISLLIFGTATLAHAATALLYGGNVKDILNDINKLEKQYSSFNVKIRGTHYYNGKDGFRYCESNFGDNDKHRLIFRLNDKGAVRSAWVIMPTKTISDEINEQGVMSGALMGNSIFRKAGLSDEEGLKLSMWLTKLFDSYEAPNKTFSVWCSKSKRYIDFKVSVSYIDANASEDDPYDFLNYYVSAHT